jgi:hypothetical protein
MRDKSDSNEVPVNVKVVITETRAGSEFLQARSKGFDAARPDLQTAVLQRLSSTERAKVDAAVEEESRKTILALADATFLVEKLEAELAAAQGSASPDVLARS